ncbi:MAG: NUDIX domain-containing protein [Reinekea sp.]|nr:NUDIX domain-containing protein [Reinekea sp.]
MNDPYIVKWGDTHFKLAWFEPGEIPADATVTTAHGYCFSDDGLLVVENHRGFELPGGHLDPGENYETAFIREVFEEACVRINGVRLLGYIRVESLHIVTKYPGESFMAFCAANVHVIEPYVVRHECLSRAFIDPFDIRQVHHHWHDIYEPSLRSAIAQYR